MDLEPQTHDEEFEGQDEYLRIVDRVANERHLKREVWHGRPRVFKPGQKTMIVPRETAIFLLKITTQNFIWTTDNRFVNRYGILNCPSDIDALLGGLNETDDVERDLERVEGWGIERTVPVKLVRLQEDRMAMRERQGSAPGVGMKER